MTSGNTETGEVIADGRPIVITVSRTRVSAEVYPRATTVIVNYLLAQTI